MGNPKVFITGFGTVNALGKSSEESWKRLCNKETGIGPLSLFLTTTNNEKYPVGEIKEELEWNWDGKSLFQSGSRTDKLALLSAREAFIQAKLYELSHARRDRTGVITGTSTGGIFSSEPLYHQHLTENLDTGNLGVLCNHEGISPAELISDVFDLKGPCIGIVTACSSGANALALAWDMITSEEADIVLAGGADALSRITYYGFISLRAMDTKPCRPFDIDRAGMSLGEGGAFLVLESEKSVRERDVQVFAELLGYGNSADAYHPTHPHPSGRGAIQSMTQALIQAKLEPQDIDYINAHGTATPANDKVEALSIRSLFGEKRIPWISSVKGAFGHTLGAAGAIEAWVSVLTLVHQLLPSSVGLINTDPECQLPLIKEPFPFPCSLVLSNSFAFGGNNTSIILKKTLPAK